MRFRIKIIEISDDSSDKLIQKHFYSIDLDL